MKKRNRRGDPGKQRYWEEVVRRWRDGGQTVRVFCRAEGVREWAFYSWRRRLARRGRQAAGNGAPAPARPGTAAVQPSRPGKFSFLPVRVVAPTGEAPENGGSRGVEIVLGWGRTVRVQAGFDRQTLADVLSVLEERPC